MRDRHILGEGTYAALLEMALLGDERELPWSEQIQTVGVIHSRSGRSSNRHQEMEDRKRPRGFGMDEEELADVVHDGGNDRVLDDAQLIRNVLPLVLIFQCLPAMPNSVQVCLVCYCYASANCEVGGGIVCRLLSCSRSYEILDVSGMLPESCVLGIVFVACCTNESVLGCSF